ncbi:hypothetical protein [Nocardia brasiliensis]
MLRDARVSLLVLRTDTGRYAEVRGHVALTDDPGKVLLHHMFAKYMAGATPPPESAAERITPERVYAFPPA